MLSNFLALVRFHEVLIYSYNFIALLKLFEVGRTSCFRYQGYEIIYSNEFKESGIKYFYVMSEPWYL